MSFVSKNKLWFKAKNYGWGWYPVTWEGWTVTIIKGEKLEWRWGNK